LKAEHHLRHPVTNKYDEYTHNKHVFKKTKWEELFTGYKPRITALAAP
jgi:hypothetical protein